MDRLGGKDLNGPKYMAEGDSGVLEMGLVHGAGFRAQGSGFRVQGSGCRVEGAGLRVQG